MVSVCAIIEAPGTRRRPMIVTPQAVENVGAIAAVEGVDGLLVGTNDLCMEMERCRARWAIRR